MSQISPTDPAQHQSGARNGPGSAAMSGDPAGLAAASAAEAVARMGTRRFGRVNWIGLGTLIQREVRRFLSVWNQTLAAPLVTAGLFLTVFSLALGQGRPPVDGIPFLAFLAPGILMMTVIQNAFANTSSSMVIAKVQGNIVDTLMPPLSPGELVIGLVAGGVARGLMVAMVIMLGLGLALGLWPQNPLWLLLIAVLGSALMASLGLLAGIWSNKFDQIAAITNFIVVPMSFLSGTFYSLNALPGWMQTLSHANPIFYLIDGTRHAYLGWSDSSPWLGLGVAAGALALLSFINWRWIGSGFRLKP